MGREQAERGQQQPGPGGRHLHGSWGGRGCWPLQSWPRTLSSPAAAAGLADTGNFIEMLQVAMERTASTPRR